MQIQLFVLALLIGLISFTSCQKADLYSRQCDQTPKYLNEFDLPDGLYGYNNYEQALKCAKISHKPLAIYFNAHGCTHCNKFEKKFLESEEVSNILNKKYVFVSLKVDSKEKLPEKDWFEYEIDPSIRTRKVRTIGHLNCTLFSKYPHGTQPMLFIADHNENTIKIMSYHPDGDILIEEFKNADEGVK